MPTPDMSDEELDDLVRRSAEAYPEELPLGNWLRMEEKLHKAATERLIRQRLWRFFGLEVAIVALLLLLWQSYRLVSPAIDVAQRVSGRATAAAAQSKPAAAASHSAQPITAPKYPSASDATRLATVSTPGNTPQASVEPSVRQIRTATASAPQTRDLKLELGLSDYAAAALVSKRRIPPSATEQRTYAALGSNKEGAQANNPTRENAGSTSTTASSIAPALAELAPLDFQLQDQGQYIPLPIALQLLHQDTVAQMVAKPVALKDSTANQKATAAPFYRVVVGVVGAPAWSAVRTLSTAQLGGNLGLTLEYRLNSRLRVRSGLVRSVKRYEAASSDYTPQPAWNWRPGTYEVYANCRITEIPLDLRYDVVSKPTYSVFASAGLTSLLMRHERYAYDYQVSGQTRTAAAKVVNGSNYAFGLFTASVGMERPFGGRWAGQIEPFLQLPLGSVGAGKVRLSSGGVSFCLKYSLLR